MKSANISPNSILVPDDVERSIDRVADDLLLKSIQKGGIQQPLVLVDVDGNHVLVDGLRRLRVAHALGLSRVPVVIDAIPANQDADSYRRRLRFHLDEHRQDLLPSQKAQLIETLRNTFGMTSREVAVHLGVTDDTVTNVTQIKRFISPIVSAIDKGEVTMGAARVFVGLSEEGQKALWKSHKSDLMGPGCEKKFKELRAKYPPQAFPKFYNDPEQIAARLARQGGERKSKKRFNSMGAGEKAKLLNSFGAKEIELRDTLADLKTMKAEIAAAAPIVHAILRNEVLKALVPADMLPELERFAECY